MKIPISKRLLACCDYISQGERVADIGTDHGYLGIWLLNKQLAQSVIAADIAPGPLSSARKNAIKFGYADKMEFYLSNGAQNIPRDFTTLVCAGMGADTIVSILSDAPWLQDSRYKLILQCQSKTPLLRKYLSNAGFSIRKEAVLRDGRFLYTVMCVEYAPGAPLTPGQWYISPALLAANNEELSAYFHRVVTLLERQVELGDNASDPSRSTALEELRALTSMPEYRYLLEVK